MRGLILLLFLPYLSAFKSGSTKPNGYILTRFNNLSKYGATRVDCMLQMSSNSLEWVRSLADDIDTTKIAVSSFAGGLRGVKSVGKIISKDIILSVPAEYVLEVTNNKPPTPFPDFVQQDIWEQSLWYQRLAFKLLDLVKNKKDSKMKYWIDQLPKSFSTPLHWDDDSLDKLQYKSVKASVILQKELWKSFYDSWKSSGQNSGNTVSYSEFEWATECVNSRAFSGVYEGSSAAERRKLLLFTGLLTLLWPLLELGSYEQSLTASVAVAISIFIRDVIYSKIAGLKRYVVCPVVDMFNHQSNNLADVSYNYFGDNFDLVANTDYSEGEQIYISYGKQSNDRLLQYYGFVEARNPYDVYDFSVGIIELLLKYSEEINSRVPIPPSPEPEQRLRIILQALENTDIESEQSKFVRKGDKDISKEEYTTKYYRIAPKDRATSAIGSISSGSILEKFDDISVRCVRALYMDTEEWNMAFSENAENFNLNEMGKKLSKQTEEKVSKVMKEIIALELAGKPTTLEEDKRLLEELQSSDKSVKGFNSKIKKSGDDKNPGKAFSTDPSGIYRDRTISAVLFRIEKKTLLTEALS